MQIHFDILRSNSFILISCIITLLVLTLYYNFSLYVLHLPFCYKIKERYNFFGYLSYVFRKRSNSKWSMRLSYDYRKSIVLSMFFRYVALIRKKSIVTHWFEASSRWPLNKACAVRSRIECIYLGVTSSWCTSGWNDK